MTKPKASQWRPNQVSLNDREMVATRKPRRGVEARDVPGVTAMVANREGTLYEGAFRKRALGQSESMTLDTAVWIASMTKALTSTAAFQLIERGKLDLESRVRRWVPQVGDAVVLAGFDASRQPDSRSMQNVPRPDCLQEV